MAALVVVALFWGNCFSCPETVLSWATHQPAHPCCHKTKNSVSLCDTQNLQHFVKSAGSAHEVATPAAPLVAEAPETVSVDAALPAVIEYPPPDLLALHSAYRV